MDMIQYRLPKQFIVGGQIINVEEVPELQGKLGVACVWGGKIKIANEADGILQTDSCKFNTFLHELTHLILDTMGEYRLSKDEKFTSCFAGFLCEALTSLKGE